MSLDLSAWIGAQRLFTAPDEIGRASIRYFAAALSDSNPLWTDDAFARSHGLAGACAPPTFVCETNQYLTSEPDADGYTGFHWDIPGIADRRAVRAAHAYRLHQPLYARDVLTVEWTLADAREKLTRSGERALVLTSRVEYSNQYGAPLATHEEVMYYF